MLSLANIILADTLTGSLAYCDGENNKKKIEKSTYRGGSYRWFQIFQPISESICWARGLSNGIIFGAPQEGQALCFVVSLQIE